LPQQIRVAVAVDVLCRESPIAADCGSDWEDHPLVRAAQIEFESVPAAELGKRRKVSEAITIEV